MLLEQIKALRDALQHRDQPHPNSDQLDPDQLDPDQLDPDQPDPDQPTSNQTTSDRLDVLDHRVEEQAQTKVEASQRFPIRITGTALFNAFLNSAHGGTAEDPTAASLIAGPRTSGATFRQTVLGLQFQGPQIFAGGSTSGSVYLDFFAGSGQALNHLVRLRVATLQADWRNTTVAFGQDKPIVSRREPDSLAQIGVSPLTGAGNPWLWQPQARVEQRFKLADADSIRAEAGIYQTSESTNSLPSAFGTVETARPALETRLAWHRKLSEEKTLEIASVLHASTSHVAGNSVPSRLFGVDWLWQPLTRIELKGLVFHGENFSNLGALGGFTAIVPSPGLGLQVRAIRGSGGWAQLQLQPAPKWTFHLYAGEQDNTSRDLTSGAISRNRYLAANLMYLLGPNVIAALEFGQNRTNSLGNGQRLNNHYDLALGYLF